LIPSDDHLNSASQSRTNFQIILARCLRIVAQGEAFDPTPENIEELGQGRMRQPGSLTP
jgi:hypothetical protein